ncbi:hypothetical protein ACHAXS_006810 [Conticribra weissflogii]
MNQLSKIVATFVLALQLFFFPTATVTNCIVHADTGLDASAEVSANLAPHFSTNRPFSSSAPKHSFPTRQRTARKQTRNLQQLRQSDNDTVEITTHYVKLIFSAESSANALPDSLSSKARDEILGVATNLMMEYLTSELEVVYVGIMVGNQRRFLEQSFSVKSFSTSRGKNVLRQIYGGEISHMNSEKRKLATSISLYLRIRIRHPTWMAPSISPYILTAFRDHVDYFINYFASSSTDYYKQITTVKAETYDAEAYLLELQEQEQQQNNNDNDSNNATKNPSLRPTPPPTNQGSKQLIVPIKLSFEGLDGNPQPIGFEDDIEELVMLEISNVLKQNMDPDLQLLEVVLFQNGRRILHRIPLHNDHAIEEIIERENAQREQLLLSRLLSQVLFFVEVVVQQPLWMTSSFARSQVLAALQDNVSILSNKLIQRSNIYPLFSTLSSIEISTFDVDEILGTFRPTQQPTRRPTNVPTQSPIVIEKKNSTYYVQLVFDGITSSSKNSPSVKADLVDLILDVLKESLNESYVVMNVALYKNERIRRFLSAHEVKRQQLVDSLSQRRLTTMSMPVEIMIQHPASTDPDVVFDAILQILTNNFGTFGKYIQSLPGNSDYVSIPNVSEYDPYAYVVSTRPTRRPTPPPALGYKTDSFLVDLVFEGVSPYYIISVKLSEKIASLAGDILSEHMTDPEIQLIDVTLPQEGWDSRRLSVYDHQMQQLQIDYERGQAQMQKSRKMQEWFLLPLLFTLQYRAERNEALALTFVALNGNIDRIDTYLHANVGGVFDGMTDIKVQHHFAELDTAPPTITPPVTKKSNSKPWWVWVVVAVGAIVAVLVFFVMCGIYSSSKKAAAKANIRATNNLFLDHNDSVDLEDFEREHIYQHRSSSTQYRRERKERVSEKKSHRKKRKKSKHRPKRREWDEDLPLVASPSSNPLALPPPKQERLLLTAPNHKQQHLALPAPPQKQKRFALPAPPPSEKPPPQLRSNSLISDLTVSIYPRGERISTLQKNGEACHSTALVVYEKPKTHKAPDPEEFILEPQPIIKDNPKRHHPDPVGHHH